jgi:hypothetical protein
MTRWQQSDAARGGKEMLIRPTLRRSIDWSTCISSKWKSINQPSTYLPTCCSPNHHCAWWSSHFILLVRYTHCLYDLCCVCMAKLARRVLCCVLCMYFYWVGIWTAMHGRERHWNDQARRKQYCRLTRTLAANYYIGDTLLLLLQYPRWYSIDFPSIDSSYERTTITVAGFIHSLVSIFLSRKASAAIFWSIGRAA